MKYRRFGRTELRMPVFTCGGMRYQFKWQDVAPSEIPAENQKNLEATIVRALELGINHIETARGYGTSEMQLGRILPKLPRAEMIVQTKIAPMPNAKDFRKTFDISMKYLGLEYVDLLSIHGLNLHEHLHDSLKKGGCLEEARKLQQEGRCRFVGFSTHATTDIILDAVRGGDFDYMNVHWYFVNDLNWIAIEEAARRDMGVFIISPNDKGGKLYSPPQKLIDLCAPLSPMIFNDLYCLARPEVHTLSIGAARPSDFDEHVKALEWYDDIPKVIPPIVARLEAEMDRTLGRDWREHWHEGLPDYLDVPGEVNVTEILRLWTYAKSLDLVDWGKMRYNLLGQGGHWFPGANAAKVPAAPNGKWEDVLKNSAFKDRIPKILQESHDIFFEVPVKRLSQS
jgi:predicted aldo/keto reductase-like oxidoreductase